jgi:uncharacterized membrane protein YgcG
MNRRLSALVLGAALLAALAGLTVTHADDGWTIERFDAQIAIQPDASLRVVERIDVDFGTLQRRGIFREIPVRYDYNAEYERVYRLRVESVTNAEGRPWPYTTEQNNANERIRIGDPDRTVSGRQSYRITYRLDGVLNAFPDHDELYWNVNGPDWPVPIREVTATVTLAGGGLERATCFQGATGSTDPCAATLAADGSSIAYTATRPLQPGQQLTVVAAVRKGALAAPAVILEKKPRQLIEYFEVTPLTIGAAGLVFVAGLGGLLRTWWLAGRDRRYTTVHRVTNNPEEQTRPLFEKDTIVVEFQPPENLRPAEVALLIDERVETRDATATIVDLAVRGYLSITEVEQEGVLDKVFGRKDWRLTKQRSDTSELRDYERTLFAKLFATGDEVLLSDLKNTFYTALDQSKKQLYQRSAAEKWFTGNPETRRTTAAVAGILIAVLLGGGAIAGLGYLFGGGLIGVAIVLLGLLTVAFGGSMARRTAHGSELMRRSLGFREYIRTAETNRQRFNEQANIFAAFLPYAIVFDCVDKWARAFRDIDVAAATAGWYVGTSGFHAGDFSRGVESFSSSVSSTIASTPGSSGGSGFSGGSAGGGGGGGGGGSW